MNLESGHSQINVGIVGARGYSGQELCRLLLQHPQVKLKHIFFSDGKSFSLWSQFPELKRMAQKHGHAEPIGTELDVFFKSKNRLDVVFLATPNEVSMELAEKFLNHGESVIDLSGIFRLNQVNTNVSQALYSKFYGIEHSQVQRLSQAVFGLHPFNSGKIESLKGKPSVLVANPGCYVTSVLMALIPLAKAGLIDETSVVVDAKSGASGAGKKLSESLLFTELSGDFYPYKVRQHQHVPEMEMYLDYFKQNDSNKKSKIVFTPHLLPVFRGILSTCYLKWSESLKVLSIDRKNARVQAAYQSAYENYPLVDWGSLISMEKKISLKAIAGTPMTHIGYDLDNDNLIVFSALDNLLKGAASQAVENLNSIYGFPLQESLG